MKGTIPMKKFKKSLCVLLSCLMIIGIAAFAPVSASAKAKPKLNKKSVTIKRGKTYTLKLKNAKSYKVKWSSSKTSVAKVYSGKVYTYKTGKATITAKYNGKKYKCKVTVKPNVKKFGKTFTVYVNDTLPLIIKNSYGSTYNAKSWKSSNKKVATINSKGIVTGKKVGTVTITATTSDGDKIKGTVKVLNPYKALKEYINKNGKADSEGNYYISFDNDEYSYFITYNKSNDKFEFQGDFDNDKNAFEVIMYMNASGASENPVVSYYRSSDSTKGYKTEAVLNPASFTSSTELTFTYVAGNIDESIADKYSNMMLQDSFSGWEIMLKNKLEMNLSALGFKNYK